MTIVGKSLRGWAVISTATGAMAAAMLPLYTVSALAPFLVADLGLTRAAVGALVTVTFAVASAVSLVAGHAVDLIGARAGLAALFGTVAAGLLAASLAPTYGLLLAALALAGVGQALANPATNVLIAERVQPERRGTAIGVKQSGVQLAALGAGLTLPAAAAALGWHGAMRLAALVPIGLLIGLWRLDTTAARSKPAGGSWWRWRAPSRWLAWLMGYSLLLGCALAAVNTYLPLYASQRLGLGTTTAGWVLAAFGVSGLAARLWWTGRSDRMTEATVALVWLSAGAAGCAMLVWLAGPVWPGLVWLGAIGVGATATAGNAVSMLAVVKRASTGGPAAGHASGLVSLGFFAGFVFGPPGFGALTDRFGYTVSWSAAVAVLAASSLVAVAIPRR